jgi:hypothetical protein
VLSRYLGLDIYKLIETGAHIGGRARGAYWLTFLGQPLFGQLGGLEVLRDKLPFPQVSFQPMESERLLITLEEVPGLMVRTCARSRCVPMAPGLAASLKTYLGARKMPFMGSYQ